MTDVSLREIKKARSKIALYEATLSLMGDKMLHEVMLEDICKKAEVSRVTFFKFFPQKDDVLIYFMRIWLTERKIEIEQQQMQGFKAIRHILHKVAEQAEKSPGVMTSLISFLAQMKMHPTMPELSEAEIQLLFPDHVNLSRRAPSLYDIFYLSMTEANQSGALKAEVPIDHAVKALFTIFYGAFLTAQQFESEEIAMFYDIHLQLLES
ncbi:TetR/AcrR family transcriptional regulator [Bacillus horti]|nr:TetR/AcrR family transcriptional regulator [Bacillus horti]